MQIFDELFGGGSNFLPSSRGIDFAESMGKSFSLMVSNPVSHTNLGGDGSAASNVGEQLFNKANFSSRVVNSPGNTNSPTAWETGSTPFLKKSTNKDVPMVMCRGSSFPVAEANDKNIEVLSAWRSITTNPQFKVGFFINVSGHRISDAITGHRHQRAVYGVHR
jgi:AP-1-like factor